MNTDKRIQHCAVSHYSTAISVQQGEAAQHTKRSTCWSKPLGQGSRKSDADREKPGGKEEERRIKDKGCDFLTAIYDLKFF